MAEKWTSVQRKGRLVKLKTHFLVSLSFILGPATEIQGNERKGDMDTIEETRDIPNNLVNLRDFKQQFLA